MQIPVDVDVEGPEDEASCVCQLCHLESGTLVIGLQPNEVTYNTYSCISTPAQCVKVLMSRIHRGINWHCCGVLACLDISMTVNNNLW